MDSIAKLRHDWFTHPTIKKNGYAFYSVRIGILNAINELKSKISGNVVDIGCGIMPYKELLLQNKNVTKYIGVDLKPTEYHHQVTPDLYWDGIKIPLEDNSVDWIIATEFFEHYYDTLHILKEINRVLKPNGTLFFTVPFIWTLHEVPYDEYRFTPFNFEKKCKESNFNNIEIKPLGGFNHAVAQMIGLWMHYAPKPKFTHKLFHTIYYPIYRWLLKNDKKQDAFDNNQMYSGLYGFITK